MKRALKQNPTYLIQVLIYIFIYITLFFILIILDSRGRRTLFDSDDEHFQARREKEIEYEEISADKSMTFDEYVGKTRPGSMREGNFIYKFICLFIFY